jgi:hypothetical protein
MDWAANIADESPLEVRLIEFGNYSKTWVVQKDIETTSISKAARKRSSDSVELAVMVDIDDCERSITKPLKVACVKVERDDWLRNLEIWLDMISFNLV